MTIESSFTQDSVTEKKKLQLDFLSPESSLTQVDSDSESTSASSSMQSSISSATSSLDQGSSNVNDGTQQKKTLSNSFSKKFATFGSFMSYRRRAQSKLSQTSIKLSDDGSTVPLQSSSIEVSDESSNYVEGKVPIITVDGLHQLHILIFFLAVLHVAYSAVTMAFGRLKVQIWVLQLYEEMDLPQLYDDDDDDDEVTNLSMSICE